MHNYLNTFLLKMLYFTSNKVRKKTYLAGTGILDEIDMQSYIYVIITLRDYL